MAWIESHQQIGRHPKTLRLMRELHVSKPAAVGHLHFLWWWALDYAPDGSLEPFDDATIAQAAEWPKKPEVFVQAMLSTGWIDPDRSIHDWLDYAGRLLDQRASDAARKRLMRAAYADGTVEQVRTRDGNRCRYCGRVVDWKDRKGAAGGTYDHVDPRGETTVANLVVACRSCNTRKGPRTPEEAGMVLVPAPDRARSSGIPARTLARSDLPPTRPTVPDLPDQTTPTEPDLDSLDPKAALASIRDEEQPSSTNGEVRSPIESWLNPSLAALWRRAIARQPKLSEITLPHLERLHGELGPKEFLELLIRLSESAPERIRKSPAALVDAVAKQVHADAAALMRPEVPPS